MHFSPDQREELQLFHYPSAQHDPLRRERVDYICHGQCNVIRFQVPGRVLWRECVGRPAPALPDRRSVGQSLETIRVERATAREWILLAVVRKAHMAGFGVGQSVHHLPVNGYPAPIPVPIVK